MWWKSRWNSEEKKNGAEIRQIWRRGWKRLGGKTGNHEEVLFYFYFLQGINTLPLS